jgi:hypothetical protein
MEPLRLQAVAARVVAWHNQHPLARPITAAHVFSIGYVALPFRSRVASAAAADPALYPAEEGGSLRERAMARAGHGDAAPPAPVAPPQPAPADLQRAFSETFIPRLRPAWVARWASRHGRTLAEPPSHAPLRLVQEDIATATAPHALTLYVLTAAIEIGSRRSRVLLGGGQEAPVLGQRLWDWPRLGGLAAVALLLVAGGTLGYGLWHNRASSAGGGAAVPEAAVAAASAASAASGADAVVAAPAAASAPVGSPEEPVVRAAIEVPVTGAAGPHAGASAAHEEQLARAPAGEVESGPAAPAAAMAASAQAGLPSRPALAKPLEAAPRQGRIALPVLADLIPEAARAEARAARQARDGGGPAGSPAAAVAPPHDPVWAISTRPLRTRTEADQVMAAMDGLLRPLGTPDVRTEVLPQGDDWRVVGWPYTDRREADRALAVLLARGMRVQVIDF